MEVTREGEPAVEPDEVLFTDQEAVGQMSRVADELARVLDKPVAVADIQPQFEQHPFSAETRRQLEADNEGSEGSQPALSGLIPALRKTVRTTPAINLLGRKIGWLSKRSSSQVTLK